MVTSAQPQRVAVLALDGVYPFELGIPSRIFESVEGLYAVSTCSVDGEPVQTAADFSIAVEHGPEILEAADIVVVISIATASIPRELSEELVAALDRISPRARVV